MEGHHLVRGRGPADGDFLLEDHWTLAAGLKTGRDKNTEFAINSKTHSTCYHFKVTLKDISPAVWRRFVVPNDIGLDRLHDIIQIVMGWSDSHLHEFEFKGKKYSEANEDADHFGDPPLDESKFRVCDLVAKKGEKISYLYDFGDSWEHEIALESVELIPKGFEIRISCLEGKNACPPEDVGGVPGYEEFLKTIANPKNPEQKEMLKWAESATGRKCKFDPKRFDEEEVSREIMKYLRWSRGRS
jgi:hypothetical protein